ncbi:D-alanyl-D-alanine carboxypeptidase [Agromyces tardus]|uniref:D-alanyl-D-alanine carboxypeptidase n=1 Tax=Agromyces tardus TaxID=2583849 RepID=A0A3M8AGP3_9MICO|nr:D-alanyl-D-alanine carboxypeptidase [Agromyces tardus]RNB50311.1 D-alanyl-D-alanine carboxypeptidase [Agromyces tardus]
MSRTLDPAPPAPAHEPPRLSRRQVYRRRRIVVFSAVGAVLALIAGGGIYTANALGAPIPAAAPVVTDPPPVAAAAQQLALPGFGGYAVGAVGFDGLLAAGNESTTMPMASIAKVVTALVVLEEHPLAAGEGGPEIAYTDADVAIYWDMIAQNGSVAPVVAGSSLTLRESLEAMLLPSGNNYSISLANWAFGSVDAYVPKAQAWLAAHGLAHTTVVDTSGLSLDDVSTPADLVKLGEIALENPAFAEIVATKSVDIPELGTIENSNKLLGTHGIDGIKTGTTDDAANLLFSADYAVGSSTVTVVGVLLGGVDHATVRAAVASLLDSVAPGFHEVTPLQAGQELASYSTPWGDTATARATEGATVVVWSDMPVDVAVDAKSLTLADDGTAVGTVIVTAGAQRIEVPLELDGTVDDPGMWWRLENPGALEAAAAAK